MILRDGEGQRRRAQVFLESEHSPFFIGQKNGSSLGSAHLHQSLEQGFKNLFVLGERGQTGAVLDEDLPPIVFGMTPKEHVRSLFEERPVINLKNKEFLHRTTGYFLEFPLRKRDKIAF